MFELRTALRGLLRRPLWTAAAISAIALGVGLSTAAFSIVYGSVLLELPIPEGNRLHRLVWADPSSGGTVHMRRHHLTALRETPLEAVDAVAGWLGAGYAIGVPGKALQHENGAYVSSEFFPLIGVEPLIGRWFLPDESHERLVVISHDLWQREFGADPDAMGTEVRVWHQPATIVGVMPPGFRFPLNQDVWMPLETFATPEVREEVLLQLLVRLPPAPSRERARQELASALGELTPDPAAELRVEPFIAGYTREVRRPLWYLWLGALGVLLIGCLNTGQLVAARVVQRSGELSIREALGGGGVRRAWTVLAEVLLIAAGGVALGVPIALASVALYQRSKGLVGSYWVDIGIHPPVIGFVAFAFVAASALATGAPWAVARKIDARDLLHSGATSPGSALTRLGHASIIVQITLCLAVLVAASLMQRSLSHFADRDLVQDPRRVVTASLSFYGSGRDDPTERLETFRRVRERLEADPLMAEVAYTTTLPGQMAATVGVELEDGRAKVKVARVSPGYFATLGHHMLQGRDFGVTDGPQGAPVALVDSSFARRYFPDGGAVGKRLRLLGNDGDPKPWVTIVGLVPDLFLDWAPLMEHLRDDPRPGVYLPLSQNAPVTANVVARARGNSAEVLETLRRALRGTDPDAVVSSGATLENMLDSVLWRQRSLAGLFGVLSAAALFLSTMGVASLAAFVVERRGRELGLRSALGAPRTHLLTLILKSVFGDLAIGLTIGAALSWVAGRLLRDLLFGIESWTPRPFVLAGAILVTAALAAAWIPARRAARADPMVVLRGQ